MSPILGSLSEVATSLFQSLRLSHVVPAFIFWALNAFFILPNLPPVVREFGLKVAKNFSLEPVALITLLSLLGGYFLFVLNTPIIRWFEGYPWKDYAGIRWLYNLKTANHQKLQAHLEAKYYELTNRYNQLWNDYHQWERTLGNKGRDALIEKYSQLSKDILDIQLDRAWYAKKLQHLYPTSRAPFLPTRMGNVIASFEDYSHSQYGIDSVTLWPRFLPVLSREKYVLYLEREKTNLDFLLNLCLISLLFSFELFVVGMLFGKTIIGWLAASGFAISIGYLFYLTSISGAMGWGNTVRVAFDLYRHELLGTLRIRVPSNMREEKLTWLNLSSFYRDHIESKQKPDIDYKRIEDTILKSSQNAKGEGA